MRFEKAYIDNIRETAGEEAAAVLEKANAEEDHRERQARFKTEPEIAKKYPRMVHALKSDKVQLPTFADDAAAEAYLQQQEQFLISVNTPLPGQEKQAESKKTENAGETEEQEGQEGPIPINADDLGKMPGAVPWSDDATQDVLRPSNSGQGATRLTVIVSEADALMDPEPGQFKRGRDRDLRLIRTMMIANSMIGGPQQMAAMRRAYEDPDVFPLASF